MRAQADLPLHDRVHVNSENPKLWTFFKQQQGAGELVSQQCAPGLTCPCMVEHIYLWRPDSMLSNPSKPVASVTAHCQHSLSICSS